MMTPERAAQFKILDEQEEEESSVYRSKRAEYMNEQKDLMQNK